MTIIRQAHDRHRRAGARIEADEFALLGDVHGVAPEGDAEGSFQSTRDCHHAVGDAVMIRVGQLDDQTRARLRGIYHVAGAERHEADVWEIRREHGDLEPGRNAERVAAPHLSLACRGGPLASYLDDTD